MMHRIGAQAILLACLLTAGLLGSAAMAQSYGPATDYVSWSVEAAPEVAAPGSEVRLLVRGEIEDGWKMYAVDSPPPTRGVRLAFEQVPAILTPAGDVTQSEPKEGYDPNFDKTVRYFENRAELQRLFRVAPDAGPGEYRLDGAVHFMICNDRLCLPPTKAPFSVAVAVGQAGGSGVASEGDVGTPAEGEQVPGSGEATVLSTDSGALGSFGSGGLWGFLLLAVGAGLAALLTPCVFPMIPLTISFFTKHAEDRSQALRMASVYGLSIVVTFTGLGVLTAVLVGAAGAQTVAANPWVNLFIGAVFVIFALSLLGLFELRLPSGLVNYFNRQSNEQHGYLGVLFMGLTLTLVSFSCTAPFVGGLLAAAAGGRWSYPLIGMLAFSATFALPFVFFAFFPRALSALPKSGSWMHAVKVVLGFVELAAALKFLSNADLVWGWGLISRPLAIAISTVIFFLAGLYLLGKLRLQHDPPVEHVGVGRLLFAIAFFGLSLYMLPGLFGAPLNKLDAYLPPRTADDVSLLSMLGERGMTVGNDEDWITDDVDLALEKARAEGKPVFVDFTGYTCTNCREMEANVFTRPEIAERLRNDFVLLRLYTDGPKDTELQRYQLRLTDTVALPTYVILDPFEHQLIAKISGVVPRERFAAFLEQGRATFARHLAVKE